MQQDNIVHVATGWQTDRFITQSRKGNIFLFNRYETQRRRGVSSMPDPSLGVSRAADFLMRTIGTLRERGCSRLPTMRDLAVQCRCSTRTILQAIRLLEAQGAVTVSQRSGIHLTATEAPPQPMSVEEAAVPQPRRRRWEQVHDALARDIITHRYHPGTILPAVKELGHRYGASFVTAKKAIVQLVRAGKLIPYKRGYRVFGPAPSTGRGAVVIVARTDNVAFLQSHVPSSSAMWHALEQACQHHGVDLLIADVHRFIHAAGDEQAIRNTCSAGARGILGYVVLTMGLSPEELRAAVGMMVEKGRPAAVLDNSGDAGGRCRPSLDPLCRVFTVGCSPVSGEIVGNYLLGLGHRRVAGLQLSPSIAFCVNRIEGVRRAFASVGLPDGVVRLTFTDAEYEEHDREVARRLAELHGLFNSYEAGEGRQAGTSGRPHHFPELHNSMWGQHMRRCMIPLFERALNDAAITAWVAVNDPSGFAALDYLRGQGVRVPEDIAIVAFDNSLESFGLGLSSYSFNPPAVVDAMFVHILQPPHGRRKAAGREIEIPGRVMARRSSERVLRWRPGESGNGYHQVR